jgi:FixJ family two-component response regulator
MKVYDVHCRRAQRLQAEAELRAKRRAKRRAERQAKLHRQAEELRKEFVSLTRKDRNLRILAACAAGLPRRVIAQAAGLSIARTDQIISAGRAARQAA